MRKSLRDLNLALASENLPLLNPRTGLNTGLMTVGNMGSSRRFDYTVMGSSVNLASRLEGVNKVYGSRIMASRATVEAAGDSFAFRELDSIRVMGQKTPVDIFELLGYRDDVTPEELARMSAYADALSAYREGLFEKASSLFAGIPGDAPSASLKRRCDEMASRGSSENWDGVFDMTSK
jgi:adenylate cyclase